MFRSSVPKLVFPKLGKQFPHFRQNGEANIIRNESRAKKNNEKIAKRKSRTCQRFQRLIFSTARPTGSIGQEHNLQKKRLQKQERNLPSNK